MKYKPVQYLLSLKVNDTKLGVIYYYLFIHSFILRAVIFIWSYTFFFGNLSEFIYPDEKGNNHISFDCIVMRVCLCSQLSGDVLQWMQESGPSSSSSSKPESAKPEASATSSVPLFSSTRFKSHVSEAQEELRRWFDIFTNISEEIFCHINCCSSNINQIIMWLHFT